MILQLILRLAQSSKAIVSSPRSNRPALASAVSRVRVSPTSAQGTIISTARLRESGMTLLLADRRPSGSARRLLTTNVW